MEYDRGDRGADYQYIPLTMTVLPRIYPSPYTLSIIFIDTSTAAKSTITSIIIIEPIVQGVISAIQPGHVVVIPDMQKPFSILSVTIDAIEKIEAAIGIVMNSVVDQRSQRA